jgi:predicted Fe-S protein YdhL (DUF1289 family)
METPCVRTCAVHPTLRLCVGCGRSLDEIARWVEFTAAERARVMAQLPQRMTAISATTSATEGATTATAPAAPANG